MQRRWGGFGQERCVHTGSGCINISSQGSVSALPGLPREASSAAVGREPNWGDRGAVLKLLVSRVTLGKPLATLARFNLAAGNSAPASRSLTPPLAPQRSGEEKWTKGETPGLR